jgi:hypothetical protein
MPPKAVLIRNFFAPIRTTEMDAETTGVENALPEQEARRKSGRPPPVIMTSTTNLIRHQSDLKYHVKGEYELRNIRNGTRIITKEMAGYSAMKCYMDKNNIQYFTFSANPEKAIKAVIRHLPPDTPAEDISISLEDLSFNAINVMQMIVTRRAPNGQTHVDPLPPSLVTLTRSIKSQEIFKLNSLNHIVAYRPVAKR